MKTEDRIELMARKGSNSMVIPTVMNMVMVIIGIHLVVRSLLRVMTFLSMIARTVSISPLVHLQQTTASNKVSIRCHDLLLY